MQNSKISKEVQGTGTAQEQLQQKCNVATKELLEIFSYKNGAKPSIQNVLLGWVGNEPIENTLQQKRFDTFAFFLQLSNHLEEMDSKNIAYSDYVIPIETYSIFLQSERKKTNLYFEEVMNSFLLSELANDKDIRSDAVYHIAYIQQYVNKIFKIKRKLQLKKCS
ncbi:hypothetical protein [Flavobacterium sp.]|uniref:hypothetical protein n=1 Tax=Flavobacterium sp. TaxID=239 RepID=UPI00286DB758|nr:hypothetical protein [Flavobacterium sp.]